MIVLVDGVEVAVRGDYIELIAEDSDQRVRQTLLTLVPEQSVYTCTHGALLLDLDDDCFAYLDLEPGQGWSARLAIGHLSDQDYPRGLVARRIYETLAARTTWRLRWTSDTCPVAKENLVEERPSLQRRRLHRQRLSSQF